MSEVVSALQHTPLEYGERGSPPTLELVLAPDETIARKPQLGAEAAERLLAQGPYIGRIAALERRLELAKAYDPQTHDSGLSLAGWVIPGIKAELKRRRQELAELEASEDYHMPLLEENEGADLIESDDTDTCELPVIAGKIIFGVPARSGLKRQSTPVYYDPVSGLPAPAPGSALALLAASQRREEPLKPKVSVSQATSSNTEQPFASRSKKSDPREKGLCAQTDPEAFFPDKGGSTKEAKRICLMCDVRQECLDYALDGDERFGIWGGYSERERRKLKKKQA